MSTVPSRLALGAQSGRELITGNTLTVAAGVQLVTGVITSKLAATMLGAPGVGVYALVQAIANIVALCALGTGEALVREWGRRQSEPDPPAFPAMLRGAELVGLAALSVVAALALILNRPLSTLIFGDSGIGQRELFLLAVAGGITFGWVTLQVNSMVAQQQVRRVSLALALAAASTPIVALVGFQAWGLAGIGRVHLLAMLASLATTTAVTSIRSGSTAEVETRPPLAAAMAEVPPLLRYGIPHVVATLFTASMLLIVPMVVAARQGIDAAGYYRAAATIAAGMATLFTFELNGDFTARIAAASPTPQTFTSTLTAQLKRVLLRGLAIVAVLSFLAPILVPLLYDQGFDPTVGVLPMVLLGQLLGLIAMTVNIAIGARFGGRPLLVNATIGGLATVAGIAAVGSLPGVGLAFVAGQAIYCLTCGLSLLTRLRRPIHEAQSASDQ